MSRFFVIGFMISLAVLTSLGVGIYLLYAHSNKKEDPTAKKKKWMVRYLRIQRVDGRDEFVHVESIELWNDGKRIYAKNGKVYPEYTTNKTTQLVDWTMANDDNPVRYLEAKGTFAHTDPTKDAYIELDFGEDVEADTLRLIFRQSFLDWNKSRIKGTRFTAKNSNGDVVLTHDITDARFTILTFTYPDGFAGTTNWSMGDIKAMVEQNVVWDS